MLRSNSKQSAESMQSVLKKKRKGCLVGRIRRKGRYGMISLMGLVDYSRASATIGLAYTQWWL